jgi:Putative MetA-pathway of phenol degradation
MSKALVRIAVLLLSSTALHAQTIDDGLMTPKKSLFTGFSYGHDSWTSYWEGELKRENGNVGTLTTQNVMWIGNYGLTDKLNLIATLPFVSTKASGGTLQGQDGLQDLTLAAKYHLVSKGSFNGFVAGALGIPVSDYVFDLLPLSIGLHSKRLSGRALLNYMTGSGFFAEATAAYTWRDNVTLDRPAYFTDGQLFLTDEVQMPDVFDYTVRAGYMKHGLMVPVYYTQQNTLGGGDIRRQDMPFVSNKMNFSRVGAMAMYTLPKPADLALQVEASHVVTGRNVGESTTVTAGLRYTIHFSGK